MSSACIEEEGFENDDEARPSMLLVLSQSVTSRRYYLRKGTPHERIEPCKVPANIIRRSNLTCAERCAACGMRLGMGPGTAAAVALLQGPQLQRRSLC